MQEKGIKHNGNLSMDEVIEIAKVMRSRSCAKNLKGTVKEILGTCVSVGCTVDHQEPRELQEKVGSNDSTVCRVTACNVLHSKSRHALCVLAPQAACSIASHLDLACSPYTGSMCAD